MAGERGSEMAFYRKPDDPQVQPASSGGLPPVSRDRLESVLKAHDYRYFIDSEGDIGGSWDGHLFYFFFYGDNKEILQIRGRWNRELPVALRAQVLEAIDQWHQDKIWPKVYTRHNDGNLAVYSEFTIDLEQGVTDEQLNLLVSLGISPACSAFDNLNEKFPATVEPQ